MLLETERTYFSANFVMKLFDCTLTKCFEKRPCIYAITNKCNGKIYVGKTKNLYFRHYQYMYDYRKKTGNINEYLVSSIKKYSPENFDISVIEFCDLGDLEKRELYWMKTLKTTDRTLGYNLRMDSKSKCITHSSTRKKISNRLKTEWKEGKRCNHGSKLKKYWKNNHKRRRNQSRMMSKVLTKYSYEIYDQAMTLTKVCSYSDLCKFGLRSVISYFYRCKCNQSQIKGFIVKRIKIS